MSKPPQSCDLQQCLTIEQTCAVFNLRKASRVVTQCYEEILRPSGLLPTQFTLLVATRAMGPVAISKMAQQLSMDRTTLTRNLKPLQREGLLLVTPGKGDRRSREVVLTAEGLKQLQQALPLWQQAQHEIKHALGADRLDRLLGDLKATVDVMAAD